MKSLAVNLKNLLLKHTMSVWGGWEGVVATVNKVRDRLCLMEQD